jgi:hypothetical protein
VAVGLTDFASYFAGGRRVAGTMAALRYARQRFRKVIRLFTALRFNESSTSAVLWILGQPDCAGDFERG